MFQFSKRWLEDNWFRKGYVTPPAYIYPLLRNKFGRQLVSAASNNALVRAYAAKDSSGNLTVFIVNNSPTESATVTISVSNFTPASTGEQWLIEPVYTGFDSRIPGTTLIQEWDDVQINGIVHPDPRIIDDTVWSNFITAGSSFSVTLAASRMTFIRLLPGGTTPVPHPAATSDPTPTPAPTDTPALTVVPTSTPVGVTAEPATVPTPDPTAAPTERIRSLRQHLRGKGVPAQISVHRRPPSP